MTMKASVQVAFNNAANTYDLNAGPQRATGEQLIKIIHSDLPTQKFTPDVVLDACTGTGRFAKMIRRLYPNAHLILNDFAPGMLDQARENFADDKNVSFHLGDAEKIDLTGLPKPDMVVSNLGVQWFVHRRDGLAHLFSQANKVMAFSTMMDGSFIEWEQAHQKHGIPSKLHRYPSFATLRSECESLGPDPLLMGGYHQGHYKMTEMKPLEFARHLQGIGATVGNAQEEQDRPMINPVLRQKDKIAPTYRTFLALMVK